LRLWNCGAKTSTLDSSAMTNPLDDNRFDRELLKTYQFLPQLFAEQAEGVRVGRFTGEESFVRGHIEPATNIPDVSYDPSRQDYRAACTAGIEVLARGKVAMLVLNGGLATRFGGAVKGVVEVHPGKSFLAYKLEDAQRAARLWGAKVPVVLLNSFSTEGLTAAHLAENDYFGSDPADVLSMNQTVSVRLTPEGAPFFGNDQRPRYYAPGHGEFFDVLVNSGVRRQLLARGVEWLAFCNVDNLGATIDPVIIGHHVLSGADMTVEVIEKRKNAQGLYDVGGSPVVVDGRLQVVEGFRFPSDLAQESLRDFQTNNMLFSLRALSESLELPRYLVRKTVDERPSIAFEAISCEASGKRRPDGSSFLRLGLLRVPREGSLGRFFPVKSRQDLEELRGVLSERLQAGWQFWQRATRG
jgi:UTP--glucose-1-phosphate uridylyltransferase